MSVFRSSFVFHRDGHCVEVLSKNHVGSCRIFVADVVKSFDTVDRGNMHCVLGRLGSPLGFVESAVLSTVTSACASSLLLALVRPGPETRMTPHPVHHHPSMVLKVALNAW